MTHKEEKYTVKFFSKAVVWFFLTLSLGVWFSTMMAGCNL